MSVRNLALITFAIVLPLVGIYWSLTASRLPRADFTFNNETEIQSIDPAVVSGQPEGRIITAVFEGLVRLDPKDRQPVKLGTAEDWTLSKDGRVYTFQIRKEARWSNGDPVTAEDYHYSLRRFMHPRTAAKYASVGWYIENGRSYTRGGAGIKLGDRVEVELNLQQGLPSTRQGTMLYGELLRKEPEVMPTDKEERKGIQQRFFVKIEGRERCFVVADPLYGENPPQGAEACRQVLLDFREVGVKVLDPLTLEITLKNPTSYWLELMAFYPLFPVHRGCLEEHGKLGWKQPENLVSNGPYRIAFRRPRDRIRLVKNEHYWNRDAVKIKTIDALAIDQSNTALNMYEAGEIDWLTQVDGTVVPDLLNAQPPRDDFNPTSQLSVYTYKLNVTRPPLNDKRVRKALALALNRQVIIDAVTRGPERVAMHFVPPGMKGYHSPLLGEENAEEARRLLAEAGFPDGKGFPRLEILYNTHIQHEAVAELARKQWQRTLGITVTLQNEAWGSCLNRLHLKQYDIGRKAWTGDYIDPNTFLDMYVTDGENNQTGWSNTEYDALIAKAATMADPVERMKVMHQAEAILMDEMPMIPFYFYSSRHLVRPYVRGFYNNLQNTHPLHYLWIDHEGKTPNTFLNRDAK